MKKGYAGAIRAILQCVVDWKLLLSVTTSIKIVANAATTGLQTARPVGDSGDHSSNLPIPPVNVITGGTGIGGHFGCGSNDGGRSDDGGSDGGIIGIDGGNDFVIDDVGSIDMIDCSIGGCIEGIRSGACSEPCGLEVLHPVTTKKLPPLILILIMLLMML